MQGFGRGAEKGATAVVITIDQSSRDPIYLQLRAQIIEAIATGELRAGDGLPSVRRLASDLGINLHTVNKAYAVLRDEGYLLMRGRSGAYVADPAASRGGRLEGEQDERMADTLYHLAMAHKARGGSAQDFLDVAAGQVERVWGDPGAVGSRRDVGVLGLTPDGARLRDGEPTALGRTQMAETTP